MAKVSFTPGDFPGGGGQSLHSTSSVRSNDAASGIWRLTMTYPESCCGINPEGTTLNPWYVSKQQADVARQRHER